MKQPFVIPPRKKAGHTPKGVDRQKSLQVETTACENPSGGLAGFGILGVFCVDRSGYAQDSPVDIRAHILAADCAIRRPLNGRTTISRNGPDAVFPLRHNRRSDADVSRQPHNRIALGQVFF